MLTARALALLALAGCALPLRAEELKVESTEVRASTMGAAVLLRIGNSAGAALESAGIDLEAKK